MRNIPIPGCHQRSLPDNLVRLDSNVDDVHAAALAWRSMGLYCAHSLLDLYTYRIHLNYLEIDT